MKFLELTVPLKLTYLMKTMAVMIPQGVFLLMLEIFFLGGIEAGKIDLYVGFTKMHCSAKIGDTFKYL